MQSKALHGEQVALGTIATVCLQDGDWKRIRNIMRELDIPVTAKQLGISEEAAIDALYKAKGIRDRYTILDEKSLSRGECRKVLKRVGII